MKRFLFVSILLAFGAFIFPASTYAVEKPLKVRSLQVLETKKYGATLKWPKQSVAKRYKVQLMDENKNVLKRWNKHKKRKRQIKKKQDLLEPSTSYLFRVKACNAAGCSKWSKKKPFRTKALNSTEEPVIPEAIFTLESDTFDAVNAYRESLGLTALKSNSAIAAIAREHSENMASGVVAFGHDGFSDRFAEMLVIMGGSGGGAENVAWATDRAGLAQVIADGWIASEGHRKNIEGDYVQSGMGVASVGNRYYFTQLFTSR